MADATDAILFNIAHRKADRKKIEISSQLFQIHQRVQRTLEDVGLPSKIPCSASEIALVESIRKRPPFADIGEKKELLQHQRAVLDSIQVYLSSCLHRRDLLDELATLLTASGEALSKDLISDDEMRSKARGTYAVHGEIMASMATARQTAEHLKTVGDKICAETGKLREQKKEEEEREERAKKKSIISALPLFDTETLLGDEQCWKAAVREMKGMLDESLSAVKTNQCKARVRNGVKQLNFICSALDHRNRDLLNRNEEYLRLNLKLGQQAKAYERLQRNNNQVKNQLQTAQAELGSVRETLSQAERDAQAMNERLAVLEEENTELSERISARSMSLVSLLSSRMSVERFSDTPLTAILSRDSQALLPRESQAVLPQDSYVSVSRGSHVKLPPLAADNALLPQQEGSLQRVKSKRSTIVSTTDTAALNSELQVALQDQKVLLSQKENMIKLLRKELKANKSDVALLRMKLETARAQKQPQEVAVPDPKLNDVVREELTTRVQHLTEEVQIAQQQLEASREELREKEQTIALLEKGVSEARAQALEHASKQLSESADDTSKKLLNKIKANYDAEMRRMKAGVEKDKQKAAAALQSVKESNTGELYLIRRDCLGLFRAVNRFQDSMAQVLTKEELSDFGKAVSNLPGVSTDVRSADTKAVLSEGTSRAVDLLTSIEVQLSNALCSRKPEVKVPPKPQALPVAPPKEDVEIQRRAQQAIEKNNKEKISHIKDEWLSAQKTLHDHEKLQDKRYQTLMEQYQQLWSQYSTLHEDVESMQRDFTETLQRKDGVVKDLMSNKLGLMRLVEEKELYIRQMKSRVKMQRNVNLRALHMSLGDQQRNLVALSEALQAEKISSDMHTMAADVIKKSMALPELHLRSLFQRYIKFRQLQDAKEKLHKKMQKIEYKDTEQIREYLKRMDAQLKASTRQWNLQRWALEEERCRLFHHMVALFDDVCDESGILLIRPIVASVDVPAIQPGPATQPSSGGVRWSTNAVYMPTYQISELVGKKVDLGGDRASLWRAPPTSPVNLAATISTPNLVQMDVQAGHRAAQAALTRRPLGLPIVDACDYGKLATRVKYFRYS